MMNRDVLYLYHIRDAIERIQQYTGEVTKDEFLVEPMLQDALVRQLQIIGEATRNLSDSFKSAHADIPWTAIVGMRNRVIHEYFNINLEIVWEVIQDDLPALYTTVQNGLSEYDDWMSGQEM